MEKIRVRDTGWRKAGSEINIPDLQHFKIHCPVVCKESLQKNATYTDAEILGELL